MLVKIDLYAEVDFKDGDPTLVAEKVKQVAIKLLDRKGLLNKKLNGDVGKALSVLSNSNTKGLTLMSKTSAMNLMFDNIQKKKKNKN